MKIYNGTPLSKIKEAKEIAKKEKVAFEIASLKDAVEKIKEGGTNVDNSMIVEMLEMLVDLESRVSEMELKLGGIENDI